MASPSTMASASSRTTGSATRQSLGELDDGAAHRQSSRFGARPVADCGELVVVVAELQPADDEHLFLVRQRRQGLLVAGVLLGGGRRLEGGWLQRWQLAEHVVQLSDRTSRHPPQFVADPVVDGLAQIGLERALAAILEHLDAAERLQQYVLHDVGGVADTACPPREPPAGPAEERVAVAAEQGAQGMIVATARAMEELARRCAG